MNFQIAFAIALAVIVVLVALLFGAAFKQREMQGDHAAALSNFRETVRSYQEENWTYRDMMKFLYEEGIEVRPYQAPETPKFELRIGNRPERAG